MEKVENEDEEDEEEGGRKENPQSSHRFKVDCQELSEYGNYSI